ncbi:MAG: PQQ-dependent sugar dehydrogenase [Acidobacteriota bacterium]
MPVRAIFFPFRPGLAALGLGLLVLGALGPGAAPADASLESLQLTPILTGQSDLVGITHAGDARLFLVYRTGEVRIFDGGQILATPYLDLSALITFGGEAGLMGAAFHPNYGANGFLFVYYVDLQGQAVLARYSVSGDANIADATSERRLLEINHTGTHFGGQVSFS